MRGEAAVWFLVQDYASWLFSLARRIFNKCTQVGVESYITQIRVKQKSYRS